MKFTSWLKSFQLDGCRNRRSKSRRSTAWNNCGEFLEDRMLLAAGVLDTTFGGGAGFVTTDFGARDIGALESGGALVDPSGNIVVAGATNANGGNWDFAIARYLPSGDLDVSFGGTGKVTTDFSGGNDFAPHIVQQTDGKIIAAGRRENAANTNLRDVALARYNVDGTLDPTFGTGGRVVYDFHPGIDQANGVALQSDGKIVIGLAEGFGALTYFKVARFNSDGLLDTTFGTGGSTTIDIGPGIDHQENIAIQPDDKIVVAGRSLSGGADLGVARLTANGQPDNSFSGDGKLTVNVGSNDNAATVRIDTNGKIVLAGIAETNLGLLVRLDTNGDLDTTFGGGDGIATHSFGSFSVFNDMIIQADGKLVVIISDSGADSLVARFNGDGTLDTEFGTGGSVTTTFTPNQDVAIALALQADGKIIVAGLVSFGPTAADFLVARYLASAPNTAPEIASLSLDAAMIFENESATLDGAFTDPNLGDEHTVTIDWGDGTIQVETLTIGDRSFSFAHQYLDDGTSPGNNTAQDDYTINVTVSDNNGGSNSSGSGVGGWTQLTPTGSLPLPRNSASAIYDDATNQMVVFGGLSNSTILNDVWRLSDANGDTAPQWTQVTVSGTGPSPRWVSEAAYDSDSNRMIVHGGAQGFSSPCSNQTWVLTNANGTAVGTPTWSLVSSSGPAARFNHSAAYDDTNNRLMVFAGSNCFSLPSFGADMWVLSDADGIGTPTWTQLATTGSIPDRGGHEAAYDVANNRMIVFGGANNNGTPVLFNDVHVLTNANGLGGTPQWINITPASGPAPSPRGASMVYDADDNRLVVFGGYDAVGRTNDIWILTHANGIGGTPEWQQITTTAGPAPVPVYEHSMVFDTANDRIIVFGGNVAGIPNSINTVWTFDLDGSNASPTVMVDNVAPALDAGTNETLPTGTAAFSRTGITFTDPGTLDVHTVKVDYDGDAIIDQTINVPLGVRTFDLSHIYTSSGTFTVTVTLADDDNGSLSDSFDVTVVLNTPPSTTGIANVNVLEDAPDTIINLFDSFDDAQDADADLSYSIQTNTNPGLFTSTAINPLTGELALNYAPDLHGTADITVRATDTGGLYVETTFTVIVDLVNDAPSFAAGANQTVAEDSGSHTISGWATAITAGPLNESTQTLTFIVTSNSNPGLFSSAPAIDPISGDLTFATAANMNGDATIGVKLMDGGGTTNGGDDDSDVQFFTITIESAAQQITNLVNAVQAFNSNGTLSNGQANPPLNFLNQALKDLAKGKISQAINKLNDFIGRIQNLINTGGLTSAQGQPLIDIANAAIVSATSGSPLRAAQTGSGVAPSNLLTESVLRAATDTALVYWRAAGASAAELEAVRKVPVDIVNLPDDLLGFGSPTNIWIDADAAGMGWNVADSYSNSATTSGIDLLSAVIHEFGHALGHGHNDEAGSRMNPLLDAGTRPNGLTRRDSFSNNSSASSRQHDEQRDLFRNRTTDISAVRAATDDVSVYPTFDNSPTDEIENRILDGLYGNGDLAPFLDAPEANARPEKTTDKQSEKPELEASDPDETTSEKHPAEPLEQDDQINPHGENIDQLTTADAPRSGLIMATALGSLRLLNVSRRRKSD